MSIVNIKYLPTNGKLMLLAGMISICNRNRRRRSQRGAALRVKTYEKEEKEIQRDENVYAQRDFFAWKYGGKN